MALDALYPLVPFEDSEVRREMIELHRLDIDDVARQKPNQRRSATIVFSRARSNSDIIDLTQIFDVAVIEVRLKAPLSELGIVNSVFIGMDELMADELPADSTPFSDRLDHAVQAARELMLERAATMVDEEAAEAFRRMATGPQYIYAIEIVGTANSISAVAHSPEVAGAFLHSSDAKVLELDSREPH